MDPDEIGSHPASRSPFGVDDLAGNIMELVASDEIPSGFVDTRRWLLPLGRTARVSNREQIPRSFRDVTIGLRVCADATVK